MAASGEALILILVLAIRRGKTTLTRMLIDGRRSRSHALGVGDDAQQRRPKSNGVHYDFVNRGEFEAMKAAAMLEWAEVHGNGYGTPRAPVEKVLAQGRDMLFDVDWQGASQVRERLGDDVVTISSCRRRCGNCASGSSGGPRTPPPRSKRGSRVRNGRFERWRIITTLSSTISSGPTAT